MGNEPKYFCDCGAGCENEGALDRHKESEHVERATKRKEITRSKRED